MHTTSLVAELADLYRVAASVSVDAGRYFTFRLGYDADIVTGATPRTSQLARTRRPVAQAVTLAR